MTVPNPSGAIQQQCAHLGDHLPATLAKLHDRRTSPRSTLVHAWGSPAVVLTCGVGRPLGYSPLSSSTTAVDNVEWFQQVQSTQVLWTSVRPNRSGSGSIYVQLTVPTKYPAGADFLVDLAAPIKAALP